MALIRGDLSSRRRFVSGEHWLLSVLSIACAVVLGCAESVTVTHIEQGDTSEKTKIEIVLDRRVSKDDNRAVHWVLRDGTFGRGRDTGTHHSNQSHRYHCAGSRHSLSDHASTSRRSHRYPRLSSQRLASLGTTLTVIVKMLDKRC